MYDTESYAQKYLRRDSAQNMNQKKLDKEFLAVTSYLIKFCNFTTQEINALDIGCGSGRYIAALANRGINAVGIDTAITSLKYGYENVNAPLASFVKSNAIQLPFKKDIFDVVISVELFYHFSDEVFEEILAQVSGILKPGGLFIFDIKNKLNPVVHFIKKSCERNSLYPYEIRTVFQTKKLLEKYNFEIKKKSGIFLPVQFAPFVIIFARNTKTHGISGES